MLTVELIYSPENKPLVQLQLLLQEGSNITDALNQAGIFEKYPEVQELDFGIFSKPVDKNYRLKNDDRLEIYRPLTANPMEKRRQRAKLKKVLRRKKVPNGGGCRSTGM